jgi:hypothetical protein
VAPFREVVETDSAWLVTIDTAGFTRHEIDVTMAGDQVRVKAEHTCSGQGLCIPRQLDRAWQLGSAGVDGHKVTAARSNDGVLEITLPKLFERSIPIVDFVSPPPTAVDTSAAAAGGAADANSGGLGEAVDGRSEVPVLEHEHEHEEVLEEVLESEAEANGDSAGEKAVVDNVRL